MASWFSGAALGETLSGLKDRVQSKVNINPDLIKKLALQSDEMVSERQRMGEEDARREAVRDSLAEILPWETRDSEMDILVDECREAILVLSSKDDTFTGPFVLDGGLPTGAEEEEHDSEEEEEEEHQRSIDIKAAEVSAEKLAKLQPLPALLENFDLDTHVGLVQRMLKEDPALVGAHSRLSSGGRREVAFWRNYFFHCAYARYEAGLSIDEIWSSEPRASSQSTAAEEPEDYQVVDKQQDEEIVYESGSNEKASPLPEGDAVDANNVESSNVVTAETSPSVEESLPPPTPPRKDDFVASVSEPPTPSNSALESGGGNDYEFVAGQAGGDGDDGSLDELEAEIAAALDD